MLTADSARLKIQRWMIVIVALFAPMLTGGTQKWSQGVVMVLLATAVLLQPPASFVGKAFTTIAAAILLLCAAAWLPASLWSRAWWRPILIEELGMSLPGTFSVQPWISADAFFLLLTGLLWLLLLTGRDWSNHERRWIARRICAGLMLLTIAWLFVHYAGWHVPIWVCERNFGPFPNRNQTGDLLATWSVVAAACAFDDYRRQRWTGTFWLCGIAIFLWGLTVNYSRAGVLLFFLGLLAWGILQFKTGSSMRYMAVALAILLLSLSIFLIFGGSTLERFTNSPRFFPDPTEDYRALVFRDAWRMAVRSPWIGVGLGNFEGMFTLAREVSSNHVRLLHPESDWLWLLAETGWFGPVLALALIAVFVKRTLPLDKKSAPNFRSAALVGALLFALHGFFDVSGHRLGSALPGLLLFGLASRLPWTAASNPIQPWIGSTVAGIIGGVGVAWIAATLGHWAWPGEIGARLLHSRAREANEAERFEETIRAADGAIRFAALDWQHYYVRGVAHAFLEHFEEAQGDFRRSRRLEPSIAAAPYEEGRIWIYFDRARAQEAWAEALRREPPRNLEYFRKMLADVGNRTQLRQMLRGLTVRKPDLFVEWLATASPAEFADELNRLRSEAALRDWSPDQLRRLFDAWLRAGDPKEMIDVIESNPAWYAAGWRQLATAYARKQEFQRACGIFHRSQPAPELPVLPERDPADAAHRFAQTPRDFIAGYQLYRAQAAIGKWSDALATLDRLSTLPDAPPYLSWLRAEALEHLNRWTEAWEVLSQDGGK